MTLSVSVYDVDSASTISVTSKTQHVTITEKMDAISTISVGMKGLTETHAFDDITVTYGGSALFSGIIESQNDKLRGGAMLYRFSTWKGKDNTLRLENRVVNSIYTNVYVEDIIADLLAKYPCGITGVNVMPTNKVVEQIAFKYVPLLDCIKQLSDISGFRWFVDANKDLHFFGFDEGNADTVFSTTTAGGLQSNILRDSIDLSEEIDARTANRVWIIGAKTAASETRSQTFTQTGEKIFKLGFTPRNYKVYKNDVLIEADKVKLDTPQNEVDANTVYLINLRNQVLRIPSGKPALSGEVLRIDYNPEIQIVDYFEDSASINQNGIYEKAIKDRQIIEKTTARARGRAELKRRTNAIRKLTFDTRELNVQRGKRYRVVVPELSVDSYWLCVGVVTTIQAPDTVNITKTVELEEVL
jgi:hypothetical protein